MSGPEPWPAAETDLYPPVRDLLTAQGYLAQAEVRQCDVVAVRGDELVVVELKLRLSLEALTQAARRQAFADRVYIAIPRPRDLRAWRASSRERLFLVRRLELGLLLVSERAHTRERVKVEVEPAIFDRVRSGRERAAVFREVRARAGDFNTGGSVRRRILRGHRETAVYIACCLEALGAATVHDLQKLGTGTSTWSVLNASGRIERWFVEGPTGAWKLSPRGQRGLADYADVATHYRQVVRDRLAELSDSAP